MNKNRSLSRQPQIQLCVLTLKVSRINTLCYCCSHMATQLLRRIGFTFKENINVFKTTSKYNFYCAKLYGNKVWLNSIKTMASDPVKKPSVMKTKALEKLRAFGYAFNEAGQLRQLDMLGNLTDKPFIFEKTKDYSTNQAHYEALGKSIPDVVYELLEKEGMTRSYFPEGTPHEEASFVFTKPERLIKSKKLLILVHGSGAVRAGQWARSLIINESIDHGTVIPYIRRAVELDYDILITNTNDNVRIINGVVTMVVDGHTPMKHAICTWERYVIGSNAQSVAIVAHSFGGIVTMELANHFPAFFKDHVFAVALTDSVHNDSVLNEKMLQFIATIGRNWRASKAPLDTPIESPYDALKQVSAGHDKHEWTSYSAIDSVFEFLEERYKAFMEKQNVSQPETKRVKSE